MSEQKKGDITKFLGIGMPANTELGQMGEETMAEMMSQFKPLFEKIGKPFLQPAFDSIKNILKGTEEADKPNPKKYMVLEVDEQYDVVVFYMFDKDKVKIIPNDPNDESYKLQIKPIENPIEFMEQLMSGGLKETK